MKPRIAIPTPTSNDHAYNDLNWSAYADAVSASGGVPVRVELALAARALTDLAYTCAGILLPGSPADVNPAKYGQPRAEATGPADLPRENVDELLLQDAHNLFKPILGICFGAQMLNVWRSGTLVQDLVPVPVNHAAPRGVAVAHSIEVAGGSLLAVTLGRDGVVGVNSSHHQAIGIAGDGLRISARSVLDGVAEAIEGGQAVSYDEPARAKLGQPDPATSSHHFVLGVQWHPERTFHSDSASRALFSAFIERTQQWSPRAVTVSVAGR